MWLQDFLPEDVKGIHIMTYGYNTELVGSNRGTNSLLDHRRDLLEHLQSSRNSPEASVFVWLLESRLILSRIGTGQSSFFRRYTYIAGKFHRYHCESKPLSPY